jgi:hypothetical protein
MATKQELETRVKALDDERNEALKQFAALDGDLKALKQKQEGSRTQFLEACKLQAKNAPNDRESIKKTIALNEDAIIGLEQLVAEKEARVAQLRDEMEAPSRELGEIARQEELSRELAEIEATAEQGKQFVAAYFRTINGLAQVAIKLRSCTSANRSRAFGFAENILNAKEGVRPERIFTQQELAELSKAAEFLFDDSQEATWVHTMQMNFGSGRE